NIYYKLGDHNLAMKYVGKGIVSSKRVKDSVSEIRGYRLMSNIFKEKGSFEKALNYQLIYSQAQEKYAMEQRNRQIIDIEIQYDFQQKEKEVELLKRYKDTLLSQRDMISAQNKKLVDANKDLMQFAYAVSHDLKEPLRMIGSYSQLIQRRYTSNLDASSDEFFGYVNEGVSRMSKLLDDLLKYAVIGRDDNQDWEEVNLDEVLAVTRFNLKLIIEESNTNIISSQLPIIESNRAYMTQLFQNLISNAIKFTKKDQRPEITVHYELVDNQHQISFQDNGIGMPTEALGRIFVIFQRLHKRSGYGGTGIGLSICMKIIERIGGSIFVESEEGIGSKFTVLLPRVPPIDTVDKNDSTLFLDDGL
ncbi:MAG: light-regulated signal transduction histidine kinase (bacteriophytochrome), partial [Maribacter sp.]